MSEIFKRVDVFVGTTAVGERVLMSGHVMMDDDKEQETTDHKVITDPHRLTLTSAVFTGRKNISQNYVTSGSSLKHLGRVTVPAPGWTLAEVRELYRIGTAWHLNDLRAGCAHMDLPEDTSYDVRKGIVCPVTGYRYGQKWLVEPLPVDVEERFVALMSLGKTEAVDY